MKEKDIDREKFKSALNRKNNKREAKSIETSRATHNVGSVNWPAKKKLFRRKSGS